MRTMTAKQEAAWAKKTLDAVIALGAVPDEHDDPPHYRSFALDTVHGRLRLFPYAEAIRTRFEVVPKVPPAGTSLNPCSGKWNFEFGLIPTEDELEAAIASIKAILPEPGLQPTAGG